MKNLEESLARLGVLNRQLGLKRPAKPLLCRLRGQQDLVRLQLLVDDLCIMQHNTLKQRQEMDDLLENPQEMRGFQRLRRTPFRNEGEGNNSADASYMPHIPQEMRGKHREGNYSANPQEMSDTLRGTQFRNKGEGNNSADASYMPHIPQEMRGKQTLRSTEYRNHREGNYSANPQEMRDTLRGTQFRNEGEGNNSADASYMPLNIPHEMRGKQTLRSTEYRNYREGNYSANASCMPLKIPQGMPGFETLRGTQFRNQREELNSAKATTKCEVFNTAKDDKTTHVRGGAVKEEVKDDNYFMSHIFQTKKEQYPKKESKKTEEGCHQENQERRQIKEKQRNGEDPHKQKKNERNGEDPQKQRKQKTRSVADLKKEKIEGGTVCRTRKSTNVFLI